LFIILKIFKVNCEYYYYYFLHYVYYYEKSLDFQQYDWNNFVLDSYNNLQYIGKVIFLSFPPSFFHFSSFFRYFFLHSVSHLFLLFSSFPSFYLFPKLSSSFFLSLSLFLFLSFSISILFIIPFSTFFFSPPFFSLLFSLPYTSLFLSLLLFCFIFKKLGSCALTQDYCASFVVCWYKAVVHL